MSLILDALKRAERDRKLEQAPDLSAIYQEERLTRRKSRPWFWVGGAFLAAIVALALIFRPKEPAMDKLKDKTPRAAMTAAAPAQRSNPENPPTPLPAAEKTKNAGIPPTVPGGADKRTSAADIKFPEKDSGAAIAVSSPPNYMETRKKLPAEPVRTSVTPKKTKNSSTDATEVNSAPHPKKTLPFVHELPEEIQTVLGPLEINVHMYSPNPLERRVFINMHGYREGDAIGSTDFRLSEITSDGIVIDYGDGKAVLEVKGK